MRFVKKGFTLVEVLVVLFVIGMIMAIMTTSFMSAQEKAKLERPRPKSGRFTRPFCHIRTLTRITNFPR